MHDALNEKKSFQDSLTVDGRYRLLVEAITDYAIYMLDPSGIVTSWNPGAQRFKGYTSAEIIGQHFSRFYSEEDRAAGIPGLALRTAEETGKFEAEGWRIRNDGSRFWAYVVIDAIRATDGKLIGFAKITRDLTERRAAEEALRQSEEQFRLLVQGVTDYAIYMLDTKGYISSWNAGAQRIKGYTPEEIIGQHFSTFYTPADRESGQPQKALATAASEGRFEKEGQRLRKDGSIFWAHVIIDPIRNAQGEIIGYAKITRDITERKETQEKLERTRDALVQSQKMDAIGQLTGGVAHDFNNLLMAILGSLELVRKRVPDDPKILSLLDNAIAGGQRGAVLTKRMLAFARRQDITQVALDIPDLVKGMTDLLERSIGPAIGIATRFPPTLKAASADANQLEMALLNLVVNARDAMPNGGQIVISAEEEHVNAGQTPSLKSGSYIRLSVTDTGEGMSAGTLQRAMEPFFTTKGVGKGTGLGLSMVHGLAQQSGGQFVLKSREGHGTTAELWLPVAESETATEGVVRLGTAAHQGDSRPLTILAVDDDQLVLTNTVAMLEELGHTVVSALSGKEAIAMLHQHEIDLVITDQVMPQMTGLDVLAAVKKDWPGTLAILTTGFAEAETSAAPGVPRLSKPFTMYELKMIVTQVARRHRARSATPAHPQARSSATGSTPASKT